LKDFNYLYLHGFASGPLSAKAVLFANRFSELGIHLQVPDLNLPSFQDMTLTYILKYLQEMIATMPKKELVIWGSSFGGLIATLVAKHNPQTRGLVLLAPGFGIAKRWPNIVGENGLAILERDGQVNVFHHSYKKEAILKREFFLDLEKHQTDSFSISAPAIIFHGQFDETVPISGSRHFQQENDATCRLIELEDGHDLLKSTDKIWSDSLPFMQGLASSHLRT
jgi:uncharacterized protein